METRARMRCRFWLEGNVPHGHERVWHLCLFGMYYIQNYGIATGAWFLAMTVYFDSD